MVDRSFSEDFRIFISKIIRSYSCLRVIGNIFSPETIQTAHSIARINTSSTHRVKFNSECAAFMSGFHMRVQEPSRRQHFHCIPNSGPSYYTIIQCYLLLNLTNSNVLLVSGHRAFLLLLMVPVSTLCTHSLTRVLSTSK